MIWFFGVIVAGVVLCLWCIVRSGGRSDDKLEGLMRDKKMFGDEGWIKGEEPNYSGIDIQHLGFEYAEEITPDEDEIRKNNGKINSNR